MLKMCFVSTFICRIIYSTGTVATNQSGTNFDLKNGHYTINRGGKPSIIHPVKQHKL